MSQGASIRSVAPVQRGPWLSLDRGAATGHRPSTLPSSTRCPFSPCGPWWHGRTGQYLGGCVRVRARSIRCRRSTKRTSIVRTRSAAMASSWPRPGPFATGLEELGGGARGLLGQCGCPRSDLLTRRGCWPRPRARVVPAPGPVMDHERGLFREPRIRYYVNHVS